ncbi:MAG: hypothetical protein LH645_08115 [Actinomycetia bacterium]|nr:hypothetical protein [Actinomycetes bacterium]
MQHARTAKAPYELEPYQELDADGRGRLQMDTNGCVYLEGPERDTDLVWPTDYRTETTPRGLSVTNSAGARLRIGAQVSLVGTYWEADDPLTCRYTNDNTVIYVVDFLGKTRGGG